MRSAPAVLLVVLSLAAAGCLHPKPSKAPGSDDGGLEAEVRRQDVGPNGTRAELGSQVVVATFDTGTNPFHPCFRRPGLRAPQALVGLPSDARPLRLRVEDSYEESLESNRLALDGIRDGVLHYVPDTNLLFYGITDARAQLVDDYPHGSQASSQIVCPGLGLAPEAFLVVCNWYDEARQSDLVRWAADQDWIDVIHLNVQDLPLPVPPLSDGAVQYAVERGKLVVVAAGNGVSGQGANYPMELSRFNGPPGSLVAGANDNGGYTVFSNLDPHVVMDGGDTEAAEPYGYGSTTFGGTSSASPRVAGYAAQLLLEVRRHFGVAGGAAGDGLVVVEDHARWPVRGPLGDGRLTVTELHEVVRRTADPNPHDSRYDGQPSIWRVPQPADLPFAFYPKMGYGEISEHTLPAAVAVVVGDADLPSRPVEDAYYSASEQVRQELW